MKPLDFYELGRRIASSAQTEAEHRTAINRIYYGLHHEACCRYFRNQPATQALNLNRRHTELRDRFRDPTSPESGEVARLLASLMMMRREADYQLELPLRYQDRSYTPERLADEAMYVGEALLAALELFSPGGAADGCECPAVYSSR